MKGTKRVLKSLFRSCRLTFVLGREQLARIPIVATVKIVSIQRSEKKRSGDTYEFENIATGETYMAWNHKEKFKHLRSGCSYEINGMFYNAPASEKYPATKVLIFGDSFHDGWSQRQHSVCPGAATKS
jgi:hypothetical protein